MPLVIRNGQVLDGVRGTLERADVLIEGDRITGLGPALAAPAGATLIDASRHLVVPGLVNAHTHAHNNLTRGAGDTWTLEDLWTYGPALYGGRTADDQYLSAAIGALEMLHTGCTAAFDMFNAVPVLTEEGIAAVVQAYQDVGVRAVLAPMVADIVFYRVVPDLLNLLPEALRQRLRNMEAAPAEELLRLAGDTLKRWDGAASGRIRIGVAPTIPGHCSEALLTGTARLAREHAAPIQTHVAESKVQAVNALRRWGTTIVGHLHEIDMLGPRFVAGHGVWLTEEDMTLLAGAGGAVAHNPASNLRLGSGIAPIRELEERGARVGLGTDGSMSSDNQNMFEAMRFAALVSTVRYPHRQERWIGSSAAWRMATAGSAGCLGLGDAIGAIALGRQADLVLLRADSVFLRPMSSPLNALVYAETASAVDTVLVAGRVVLQAGRVITVDEDRLRVRAQEAVERLRVQNAAAWTLARELAPYVSASCRAAVATPFPVNRYAVPVEAEA